MKRTKIEITDVIVGYYLKKFRLEKKLSCVKIAEALDYHISPQKYEKGINRINIALLRQYLYVLDISLVEFFSNIILPEDAVLKKKMEHIELGLNG